MIAFTVLKELVFSKTGKNIGILLVVLLAVGAVYKTGRSHGYAKAERHYDPIVTAEKKRADDTEEALFKLKAEMKAERDEFDKKLETLTRIQEEKVQELRSQLSEVTSRKERVREIIRTKVEYVTQEADNACVVPVGAVRLHNLAIQDSSDSGLSGISSGSGGDVDSPSTVTLSEFTTNVAWNYAECESRGEQLILWQDWYKVNKAQFDQLREKK